MLGENPEPDCCICGNVTIVPYNACAYGKLDCMSAPEIGLISRLRIQTISLVALVSYCAHLRLMGNPAEQRIGYT